MKIKYFIYLLPLLLCCCKHKDTPTDPDPNFNFEYSARYDSVIKMTANSTYSFIFFIDVANGNISNNRLACSITGLPGNATVMPTTMSVGQVLGGVFTFKTGDIPLGVDTLRFTLSSPSTGTATHKLIFKIIPPVDNAPDLKGTYDSSYDFCSPNTYKHQSVVTIDSAYTLKISNLNSLGSSFLVKARVSDIITIPYQVVSGKKIWGSGTFSRDPKTGNALYMMTINDTVVTGIDTVACIAHIQHL